MYILCQFKHGDGYSERTYPYICNEYAEQDAIYAAKAKIEKLRGIIEPVKPTARTITPEELRYLDYVSLTPPGLGMKHFNLNGHIEDLVIWGDFDMTDFVPFSKQRHDELFKKIATGDIVLHKPTHTVVVGDLVEVDSKNGTQTVRVVEINVSEDRVDTEKYAIGEARKIPKEGEED